MSFIDSGVSVNVSSFDTAAGHDKSPTFTIKVIIQDFLDFNWIIGLFGLLDFYSKNFCHCSIAPSIQRLQLKNRQFDGFNSLCIDSMEGPIAKASFLAFSIGKLVLNDFYVSFSVHN